MSLLSLISGKPIAMNPTAADGRTQTARADSIDFVRFKRLLGELQATFYVDGGVRYDALRSSSTFAEVESVAAELASLDVATLTTHAERLAFWINVYNVLTIHAILQLGVQRRVLEVWNFFGRVGYHVGEYWLSLNDIEHGILRGNRTHPALLWLDPFSESDPRRALVLTDLDPRIHFALVCGGASCPPVAAYDAARINEQLDAAARSFISQTVAVDLPAASIRLSRIFKWYASDFGPTSADLVRFLAPYVDDAEQRTALDQTPDRFTLHFAPYNWDLNAR